MVGRARRGQRRGMDEMEREDDRGSGVPDREIGGEDDAVAARTGRTDRGRRITPQPEEPGDEGRREEAHAEEARIPETEAEPDVGPTS